MIFSASGPVANRKALSALLQSDSGEDLVSQLETYMEKTAAKIAENQRQITELRSDFDELGKKMLKLINITG